MKLNCKAGDLAVVVRGGNLGRIVDVQRQSVYGEGWWLVKVVGAPVIGSLGSSKRLMSIGSIEDSRLKPIRDQPGQDETLTWAGKPSEIKTPEAA